MKFFIECAIVVVVAVLSAASAEGDIGYFIPKAFYTLDADGHKTQPHPVSQHTAQYLRRLRRQVFSSSSSSSSSASSSNGGPVYFSTQNTVSHTPGGTVSFSSRFGDDGSSSTSSHSSSGVGGSAYGGNGYGGSGYGTSGYAGNSASTTNQNGAADPSYGTKFGSAASSTSSVSSNGGPVYFKTEQLVSHTPTNINVASRFGGDIPQTVSKTVSTSGYIDEKGVHAKTTTTKNH